MIEVYICSKWMSFLIRNMVEQQWNFVRDIKLALELNKEKYFSECNINCNEKERE